MIQRPTQNHMNERRRFYKSAFSSTCGSEKATKTSIKFFGSMLGFMWRSDVRAEYVEVPTHLKSQENIDTDFVKANKDWEMIQRPCVEPYQ